MNQTEIFLACNFFKFTRLLCFFILLLTFSAGVYYVHLVLRIYGEQTSQQKPHDFVKNQTFDLDVGPSIVSYSPVERKEIKRYAGISALVHERMVEYGQWHKSALVHPSSDLEVVVGKWKNQVVYQKDCVSPFFKDNTTFAFIILYLNTMS